MSTSNQPNSGAWFYVRFAVAAIRVFVPVLLWYGFLFLPIDQNGNPGWLLLISLVSPWLWFYGLAMLVSQVFFWGSVFSLGMRWWDAALVAAGLATAILVGLALFTFIPLVTPFAGILCLAAAHLLVVLWATVGLVFRTLGLDSSDQQIP